ncbi:GNAT family N-acetyltransferase [Mucilaginibacter lappiensis]|uniref:GNAT superfamily N-acetyltransferase n=1 Tax=Mucilaginibacter lappiensis TaxID=354630 RepID=A0A841J9V9_9SPHI|nr:GNAT family N-acetyltransferase [Mucilaginibacter lappiensis]MBB6127142.1 GNAT superfamily N-acetyltransferase [Mucilaginibacter lappiensis]
MEISVQSFLTHTQLHAAYQLWNDEYPEKLQYQNINDFNGYLDNLGNKQYFLLIDEDDILQGWSATFLRDNERWFAIILNSKVQGKKYGTRILNEIKKHETFLAGWVIDKEGELKSNGSKYASPLAFYIKNGFKVLEDYRIESEKLSAVKISWQSGSISMYQ